MDVIFLLMLGIQRIPDSYSHIMASNTTLLSGIEQVKSMLQFKLVELSTDHFYRPCNKEDLFNLQHASAQNVIECIFGVLKHKFCILCMATEYDMSLQAQIPVALATVHNFIQEHEPEEEDQLDNLQPIGGGEK